MSSWLRVCGVDELGPESVVRFDVGDKTFAVVRSADGGYYAIDGYCSHERAHLSEGLVIGFEIECPRHLGAFDFRTGEAVMAPACIDLATYEVKVEGDSVFIRVE